MSNKSNNFGRGYEYVWIQTLSNEISKYRFVGLKKNKTFDSVKKAWGLLNNLDKQTLQISVDAAIKTLFDLEPMILEKTDDNLELYIQPDSKGKEGDVRDIVIARKDAQWEIGLSLKHKHFDVKHSRLGKNLDFAKSWFEIPCSEEYWKEIRPIFSYLDNEIEKNSKWRDLPNKNGDVYIPLLSAFINEVKRATNKNSDVPQKLVEYLLGKFDFYKVISIDEEKITQVQAYNLRGNLNRHSKGSHSKILVPISALPSRIVRLDFKRDGDKESKNTVELYMDKGWQFSFRLHNASTFVEPSLKFAITAVGMPSTILTINCTWK